MSAEVETATDISFQLGLVGKSPSPEYIPDEESASICPLIIPSPSPSAADFRVDPLTTSLGLGVKSTSPDFIRDEESCSICPLLTPSPTNADFSHPLDPLSALAYERRDSPPENDISRVPYTQEILNTSELYQAYEPSNRKSDSISDEGGDQQISFSVKGRDSIPGNLLESSSSSSSSALQENTSCVQLLSNHHYQHLNIDKNDVTAFITQENGTKPAIDLAVHKMPVDYCFMSWNWPIIRTSCFWTVISLMIACVCIVIGMVATLPRRCYPPHYWYQGSLFYEIFPASFQDSNYDGIGDFRGIAMRVDYFEKLGIRAVRLNSIFSADHYPEGYGRVKNLTEIDKTLGSLADFSYMVETLHRRNISVILDLPIYPLVKDLGELTLAVPKKNEKNKKDNVAEEITNVVRNHRSHRDVLEQVNITEDPIIQKFQNLVNSQNRILATAGPLDTREHKINCCPPFGRGDEELMKNEMLDPRIRYLKPEPYIDGGISGLMKHTSEHLNSKLETVVADAIRFWFDIGVDGFYIKGLENYVNDSKFEEELKKWKKISYKYWEEDSEKVIMCDYKAYKVAEETNIEAKNAVLDYMDLVDIYLGLFDNGTKNIKQQIDSYRESELFDKKEYPWIHWNVGNIDTKRLTKKPILNHGSLGPLLFEMMLPGTISIFYGDEIGLQDLHDIHKDHHDTKHIHQLTPMVWSNSGGFTRNDLMPWIPQAKSYSAATNDSVWYIGLMSRIRSDAPSIYMNRIWKNEESLSNYAIRYVDDHIIVMERSYPRRNSYVVVTNLSQVKVLKDLSHIYYGGEVILDLTGDIGEYLTFRTLSMDPGNTIIVRLDK